jgi:glycosyltransferase involved in cell wall biosynthesis
LARDEMAQRILVLGRFSPYESETGYRVPIVADVFDALRATGIDSLLGVPESWASRAAKVNHVALPEAITAPAYSARFVLEGVPGLARLYAGADDAPWLRAMRDYAPDLVVGINSNSLSFAAPIARRLGAPLVLFSLGGIALRSIFHSRGAFRPVLFEFYAPLFAGVDAHISVEDSTALHLTTPVARLPASRQLHIPIPHRTWASRSTQERQRLADLPPLRPGQRRVTWAGRPERVKRPGVFVDLARYLDPDRFQLVLVGGDPRRTPGVDATELDRIVMPGMVSTDRLEAILQSSDMAVFTSMISVAGTVFRETVAAGITVAATIDPADLLLFTLLDVERDVVMLDPRDPSAGAEAIRDALENAAGLRARADAAQRHLQARGLGMGDFVDRVTSFLRGLLRERAAG